MKKVLLLSALFGMSLSTAYAQDSDTADALIEVQAAISITQQQDLDFGTVVQGDASGTVAPGDGTAGIFDVAGSPNTAYTITLPSSAVNMSGPGTDIEVNTFVSTPAAGANGMLDASGDQQLRVGATHAAIPGGQTAGSYSGTFTVEVAY